MNRIITSAGLVALGAAAFAPELSAQESSKNWSLSGGFRGFYDSNPLSNADGLEQESWGLGLSVGAGYELPLDQTYFGVDYNYDLRWFEARPNNNFDHTHIFNLVAEHKFSERSKIAFKDNFVYTTEPTVLDAGGPVASPIRTGQDSWQNRANLDYAWQFTEKWGSTIGYQNRIVNWRQDAGDTAGLIASRSQLLDRMEHLIPVDVRYTVNPKLIALAGYQFGLTGYTSNDPYLNPNVANPSNPTGLVNPDWRDMQSHFLFLGGEYEFSRQLSTSLRGGLQYATYKNLQAFAPQADDNQTAPFVDWSVTWKYNPGSSLVGGYNYSLNATDIASLLNTKAHVVFASWTHKISSRLNANAMFQFQNSIYNQNGNAGANPFVQDGSDRFNIAGLNFDYLITKNLKAVTGYKYDKLTSDIPNRGYERHVVHLGIRAEY